MTNSVARRSWMIRIGLWLFLGFAACAAVSLVIEWYHFTQSMPDRGWHRQNPESDFCADDATPHYTIQDYLDQEDRVFNELSPLISGPWAEQIVGAYSRYSADSICNPETIVDHN